MLGEGLGVGRIGRSFSRPLVEGVGSVGRSWSRMLVEGVGRIGRSASRLLEIGQHILTFYTVRDFPGHDVYIPIVLVSHAAGVLEDYLSS